MSGLSKRNIKIFSLIITVLLFLSSVPLTSASQEIIDSGYKKGEKLKISVVLYKDTGEIDDEWDYYAIKVTIQDIKYQNNPWIGPLFAVVRICMPTWAEEVPTNHKPEAGYRFTGGTASFQYMGIGFSLNLPSRYISYENSIEGSYRCFDWTVEGAWDGIAYWGFIFGDYAEFAVGVRVPQSQKPYAYVYGWVAWYRFLGVVYVKVTEEEVYWVYVDNPGAILPPSLPEIPRKISTPKFIFPRWNKNK